MDKKLDLTEEIHVPFFGHDLLTFLGPPAKKCQVLTLVQNKNKDL